VRDTSRGVCMIQIETAGALESVEDIASLPGVDALFLGPLDLSFALGAPEDFDHQDFVAAMKRFVQGAQKAGIPAGSLISDPARIASMQAYGLDFLALGSDALALRRALSDQVAHVMALGNQQS